MCGGEMPSSSPAAGRSREASNLAVRCLTRHSASPDRSCTPGSRAVLHWLTGCNSSARLLFTVVQNKVRGLMSGECNAAGIWSKTYWSTWAPAAACRRRTPPHAAACLHCPPRVSAGTCEQRRCLSTQTKMISCCQGCRPEAGPGPVWQTELGALHLMGRAPQRPHINYMVAAHNPPAGARPAAAAAAAPVTPDIHSGGASERAGGCRVAAALPGRGACWCTAVAR